MRVLSLLPVVAGLLAGAEAHTRVYGIWLNGVRTAVHSGGETNMLTGSPSSNSKETDAAPTSARLPRMRLYGLLDVYI